MADHAGAFSPIARLRGGWFVGPEEYASMGYTLGLPPGFYAPDHPAISELVEKIRPQNGIILPSATESSSTAESKKKVMVCNIPLDMSEEDIVNIITNTLLRRKLVRDSDIISNVMIHQSHVNAFVEFKSQKDAQAAVHLGNSLIFRNQELRICWPQTFVSDNNIPPPPDFFDQNNTLESLVIESDYLLPEADVIKSEIDVFFPVENVVKPEGFNHALVNLVDPSQSNIAVYKLNGMEVGGICIRVQRAFVHENDGPMLLDPKEVRKMKYCSGPSRMTTVLSPLLRNRPCIADILNPDVPVAVVIQPETEKAQPTYGKILNIYNIAKDTILYDSEFLPEFIADIQDECNKYGEVLSCNVVALPFKSDYAIVKVAFSSEEEAKECQMAISGRRYNGRIVITSIEEI